MSNNKMIYTILCLLIIILIGMITGSFRLIIYPYMFVIGTMLFIGEKSASEQKNSVRVIPITVTLLFLCLFGWLDFITVDSPTGGNGYVLGLTPSTAIYFLGIWPLCMLLSLIYGWIFSGVQTRSPDQVARNWGRNV